MEGGLRSSLYERILIMSQNLTPVKPAKKTTKDFKYLRDKDREMVRGIFRYFEVPGGAMKFPFKKYKEDEVENYTVVDGEIYVIPRGVAHHLSNNCWYPEHAYKLDELGRPSMQVTKKKRRCTFEPLDFMDVHDLNELAPKDIETVTLLSK